MRIAFVSQWFPPEPGTFVASAIADGLAERGHQVDVLTGFPNYPSGRLQDGYPLRPYRRDRRSERVTVHRAPLYPSHDSHAFKRMANYLTFAISASWIARTRLEKPDVWLTYSSPATAALPALTVPRRMRAPSYLIVQDLWPDSVTESGFIGGMLGRTIERGLARYCGWSYKRSAGIGVIAPSMRQILINRGADPDRVHLTPNWVEDTHLLPNWQASDDLRRSLGLPTGRLFMYAGNLGELQGLPPLIEAFARNPTASLALVGDGVVRERLEALVSDIGAQNIKFMGSQPSDRIGQYIAASDVQIVSLRDSNLLRATMPSKVQASMAAGRPILAHASGDVARMVTDSGTGLSCFPGDVEATAEVIRKMAGMTTQDLRAMGRTARAYYQQVFSPTAGLDRLEAMLTNGSRK